MYERQSIRVVAGGLNLLAPGDVIGDDEAQEAINISVDSEGALRSRRGHSTLFNAGGKVIAMLHGLGGVLTVAGGNAALDGAALGGGLGDQVGIAVYQGWAWFFGAGDQRKSDGSVWYKVVPEAPVNPPTTKAGGTAETVIDDFTGGWTVDPSGDDTYAPTLQIFAQSETVYSADKAISVDLETGHTIDDLFKVTMWCKQWAKIRGVTFQLDLNSGDFTTDAVTAYIKGEDIKGGHKEEVTVYIRKRPLSVDTPDKFRYTSFVRVGSTPDKGYKTVAKARVKVDFKDTTKFRFTKWSLIGSDTAKIEGDDEQVYFTYVSDAGHESNPSPVSDPPVVCNRCALEVHNLVDSPDAQVTFINIYRTGDTLQGVYLVERNTTASTSTDYTIVNGNDDLTALGIQLEDDHDQPPAVGVLIGPFFERLIAAGGPWVYWSHQFKPYAWNTAHPDDADRAGVPAEIGDIMQMTRYPGFIYIYGTAGVAVMQGDPGGASDLARTGQGSGIQSPRAVVSTQRGDFANFHEGIFQFNGSSGQNLARKILPIFKSAWNASEAALGFRNDQVWFSDGSRTYVYDLATGKIVQDSRGFSCFLSDGQGLLGALASGDVVKLEEGSTDNGAAISIAWTSKSFDAGLHDDEKRWADVDIWCDSTGGGTLMAQAILTSPDQTISLGTISAGRNVFTFNATGKGIDARRCAIRITGSVTAEALINSIELWFYPKAREGKSFDTGELPLGGGKMFILRELLFDLDNPASAGLTVMSDRPEPAADRVTSSFLATSDRRMEPYVLSTSVIGRLNRYILHGSDLRAYGGKALVQVFGTYLEGAKGEYYLSNPLDFGTEQVKMFKEVELVYAGGGGTFRLYTDLPGNAIAERGNAVFPATTDEQNLKIKLEGTIKGRLLQVRIEPSADCRLEAVRVFTKIIGKPAATPWQWIPLPLDATQDGIWMDFGFPPDSPG